MIDKLIQIEKLYLPIIEILEKKDEYKELYKGFISFQSKLNYNPDILFLGINAGEGAYNEYKEKNLRRVINNQDYLKNLSLDWFKKGNCRGEFIEKTWFTYNWYDKTKKINNSFPTRMIDLIISFTKKTNQEKEFTEKELVQLIENEIQNKIVFNNLYPIATKSTKELNDILIKLSKEKEILQILNTENKNNLKVLKNFFRQRTIDFINVIDPKVIVFLGHTAYNDLTLKTNYKGKKILEEEIQLRKNAEKKYKIISFSRQGNWSTLINEISDKLTGI